MSRNFFFFIIFYQNKLNPKLCVYLVRLHGLHDGDYYYLHIDSIRFMFIYI